VQIGTEQIRDLRERTGAGIMDCKRALEEHDGNVDKAENALRDKGIAKAGSKAGRATSEGLVGAYIHAGGRVGAIIEINCETDFVARTAEFQELVHNVAMQVAAMAPRYLTKDELPADSEASPQEACLLEQPFIKDSSKSISDLVLELAARVGENVQISRFERFSLGES
jgi:elongation factor Ts